MTPKWAVEAVEFAGKPGMVAGYRAVRALGFSRQEYLIRVVCRDRRDSRVLMGEAQTQHEVEMNASLVRTEAVALAMIARYTRDAERGA
jgi:hypothetical protein